MIILITPSWVYAQKIPFACTDDGVNGFEWNYNSWQKNSYAGTKFILVYDDELNELTSESVDKAFGGIGNHYFCEGRTVKRIFNTKVVHCFGGHADYLVFNPEFMTGVRSDSMGNVLYTKEDGIRFVLYTAPFSCQRF